MLLSVKMLSRLNKSFQRQNYLSEPIGWSLLKHKWAIFSQDEASGISRIKVRKKANIRNRYNQIPHPTRYTIWESDKTHENFIPEGQEVSPFPAVDHNAARNREDSNERYDK